MSFIGRTVKIIDQHLHSHSNEYSLYLRIRCLSFVSKHRAQDSPRVVREMMKFLEKAFPCRGRSLRRPIESCCPVRLHGKSRLFQPPPSRKPGVCPGAPVLFAIVVGALIPLFVRVGATVSISHTQLPSTLPAVPFLFSPLLSFGVTDGCCRGFLLFSRGCTSASSMGSSNSEPCPTVGALCSLEGRLAGPKSIMGSMSAMSMPLVYK
jgi:hypothetical protein